METLKVLIVDDELQSRALIKKLLAIHFAALIVEEADSVALAIDKINDFGPNLLFLDVQMRGETGFDLLDKIGPVNFGIIFATAHSVFAVKAFRYSALDYLVKPIDEEEFKAAVEKALQRIKKNQASTAGRIEYLKEIRSDQKMPDKLTIPTAEGFLLVSIHDILYCHALSNYTEFHMVNKQKITSSYTLGYYDDLLTDQKFFRIHRSYLINLSHIKMYRKSDGGAVVMNDGEEIEISRSNKDAFLKLFKG